MATVEATSNPRKPDRVMSNRARMREQESELQYSTDTTRQAGGTTISTNGRRSSAPSRLPTSCSEGRNVVLARRKMDFDLTVHAMRRHHLTQLRVEVVLEHRRARRLEKVVGVSPDIRRPDHAELVACRYMLDQARHVREPELAQRVRAVATVVQDQPTLGIDGVQEVAAEADREPDDAEQRTRMRVPL